MSGATARWRALGTDVHVVVHDGDLASATAAVETVIRDVSAAYSRFRADSEISRLNGSGGRRTRVSALFMRALEAALHGALATDGLVDPTVGRAMRAIGYDADFDVVVGRTSTPVVHLATVPGWRAIDFDRSTQTVRLPAGVELDFGSTGKALAADMAAHAAFQSLGRTGGVLVSIGGDVAMVGQAPERGWRILAAESSTAFADSDGDVVALTSGAVATSSTTVRRWNRDTIALHHIIDPRTGAPSDGPWRTVSVVAADCVDANIAATAAMVLGHRARPWLEERRLAARLVANDGHVERVAGWPAPDDARLAFRSSQARGAVAPLPGSAS